ncbi:MULTISPECIES: AAA family ATPase [Pseudomonas aeruginosa group]|uniref:AAA family ATPase n=1 Tax=Pseudomonas aeruginosa group TaxID=136841 RepID=UPI00053DE3F7|nr:MULTISPECIES: AAA family ATPase [Pseudomonas aeruginosa group]AVR70946.1 chromosome partitioning protein ParA [Pseudomonas paraeruginosa]KJC15016.1 plasmid partitioning protein ParA [Pseudomonas aeruginosa]MCV0316295.1 AAA family ATPase [Pseudomonas aeruginosa]NPW56905.1 AAA family ATPase [Pseudomonas aeruginosa]NYU58550.1 AAA family ATPase [Pseudomonas aeruginosa]
MIVIVGGNKGGSGKTTTVLNLAVALARREGKEVCLVDADPQRSSAKWHAEREESQILPAITLVEKRENIASTLKTLDAKFDYVLVDVAGRNSIELISGATVADVIIAPHQCSQLDLDTMEELQEQFERVRVLNPELRVLAYHSMASTNPAVKETERKEFLNYLQEFPSIESLEAVGFYRKAYRDAISNGQSVLEGDNAQAAAEIAQLAKEVFGG